MISLIGSKRNSLGKPKWNYQEKMLLTFSYILSIFILILIYHGWFKPGILVGGDFRIRPPEFFIDFVKNFKYLWWENLYGGFNPIYALYLTRLPIYIFAGILALFHASYEIIQRIVWLFPIPIISFISMYLLILNITRGDRITSSIVATYYSTSPVLLERLYRSQVWMGLAYSFVPLMFLILVSKRRFSNRHAVLFSLVSSLAIWSEIRIALLALFFIFILSFMYFNYNFNKKQIFKFFIKVFILIFLFNSFWIIPFIFYFILNGVYSVIPHSIASYNAVMGSGRFYGGLVNAITLHPKNWEADCSICFSASLIIFTISIFFLRIFQKKTNYYDNKIDLILFLIYILLVFLSKGSYPPFGELFGKIFSSIPFLSAYKSTHKFALINVFIFSLLFAKALNNINITYKRIKLKILLILIILFLILLSNSFLIKGYIENFGIGTDEGWYKYKGEQNMFSPVPTTNLSDYNKIWNIISSTPGYKSLWLPTIHRYRYTTFDSPYLDVNFFRSGEYGKELFLPPNGKIIWKNVYNIYNNFEKYFAVTNIKWVVLKSPSEPEWHYSRSSYLEYLKLLETTLKVRYAKRIEVTNYTINTINMKYYISNNTIIFEPISHGNYSFTLCITTPNAFWKFRFLHLKIKGKIREHIGVKIYAIDEKGTLINIGRRVLLVSPSKKNIIIVDIKRVKSFHIKKICMHVFDIWGTNKIFVSEIYFEKEAPILYEVNNSFPLIYMLLLKNNININKIKNIILSKDWIKILDNITYININYNKINPTLWEIRINGTKPFMLVFAESYDPFWEATVYKEGRLVERVRSVPVYGTVNGFWIDETGNLTIIIRYSLQEWFKLGLTISITAFVSSIFYLIWDWRKSRGDE